MILLWGPSGDSPLCSVARALEKQNARFLLLDQLDVLETAIELAIGQSVEGWIDHIGFRIPLHEVTAVYLRPHDSRRVPAVRRAGESSPEWRHALAVEDLLLSWADIAPALVVNRPAAMAGNNSKPTQTAQLRALGFSVPDTLITTSSDAIEEFWARHGEVIYKSISGVRSIVSRLSDSHRERLSDVCWCPTQFQAYVPGRDYRVHVVGDDVFACEIHSNADDYRYAGRNGARTELRAYAIDTELADRCRIAARELGLAVAGLDLRRTPDGEWIAFEVNPSPGFTYYEEATGLPIAASVARLLSSVSRMM